MTSPTGPGSEASPSTHVAHKRKASAGEAETGRVVKHRASRACQSCRMRKVRCDVVANGSRCTNCRLDAVECVVLASRRGKNNHTRRNSFVQVTQPRPPGLATALSGSSPEPTSNGTWREREPVSPLVSPSGPGQVPVSVTFDQDSDVPGGEQQPEADDATGHGTQQLRFNPPDGLLTPETGLNALQRPQSFTGKASLPAFITPISSRISIEDLDFLAQKGAMTVPEPDLQIDILRGYLFSVHPFMPMLNFRLFIHALQNNHEQHGRVSLLLFQAVMFAGVHSLPLHVIHRLGYESAKQAREAFFERARLLYEFDVELDSTAVLQALILMSTWYSKWDERKHTWHWTGLAYDAARRMGLHREPTRYTSDKVRRFRRRLWWSLYIRDRMLTLGTRRPMRIRDDEFDVAMLTLDDFDLEPFEGSFQAQQPLISSAKESTSTALMCIQLAKLCISIGHVVSSQYTTLTDQPEVPHTMMVVARRDEGRIQELERCDKELDEWFQALGTHCRRSDSPATKTSAHSCSEVHWAVLNLTYLTVVNVLHRAQALHPLPDATEDQIGQRRSKVKDAARQLTKISQTMLRHDQVRFLGTIGVTALVAACLSHMLDLNSGDEDVRDASTFRLDQTLQVLHALRDSYGSADAAVSFLVSVTRAAGISVPLQYIPAANTVTASESALPIPSEHGKQGPTWIGSRGVSSRNLDPLEQQYDEPKANWQRDALETLRTPTLRHQRSRTLLSPNGQRKDVISKQFPGITTSVSPSAVTFSSPAHGAETTHPPLSQSMTRQIPPTEQGFPHSHFVDAMFGGAPNLPTADGAFFDWMRNGVDANGNLGLEPNPMAFNYDFYSDAFGFSDGRPQGI